MEGGPKLKVKNIQGKEFELLWDGPLTSRGHPKGRGTFVLDGAKYTGEWATTDRGYPLSKTGSNSAVLDKVEYPDGRVFEGVLREGLDLLVYPWTGTFTKDGQVVSSGSYRENGSQSSNALGTVIRTADKWLD